MSNEATVFPISVTCDWGDCDETAVGFRNEVDDHGWLPVCAAHYEAEPDKTLIAKFVTEAEVCRLREALGDILQCFDNGATPHISIVDRARAALGKVGE